MDDLWLCTKPNLVNQFQKGLVLLQTQQTHYKVTVGGSYSAFYPHVALALGAFFGKNVALKSLLKGDFTCACNLETLLGAAVGFYFWHCIILLELLPAGGGKTHAALDRALREMGGKSKGF